MDWLKWIAGAGLLLGVIWLLASIGDLVALVQTRLQQAAA